MIANTAQLKMYMRQNGRMCPNQNGHSVALQLKHNLVVKKYENTLIIRTAFSTLKTRLPQIGEVHTVLFFAF